MSLVRAIRAQAERANPAFRDCSIPYLSHKAGWEFRVGVRSWMSSKTKLVRWTSSRHTAAGGQSFESVPRAWQGRSPT